MNVGMIERKFNAYVEGLDMKGRRAIKPGFFVIGTQNPPTFEGRKILSDAVLNRLKNLELGEYSKVELVEVIQAVYGFNNFESNDIAQDFWRAKTFASSNQLVPEPTSRGVFSYCLEKSLNQNQK